MSIYGEEHAIFQKSLRRFAEKEILPFVDEWEEQRHFPSELFLKLGKEGFLGIRVSEADGGVGGDYILAGAWCEEFGRVPAVGLTTAINMHSLVITPTLARYASNEAKQTWLAAALSGQAIGAYAFTEPSAGSDLSEAKCRAKRDGDDFLLSGEKIFITNGKRANFVLVLAKTDPDLGYDGFTTFVVDTKLPGFQVTRTLAKLGWHCSDTAELHFDKVRLPKTAVLGEVGKGWHQAMESLQWERLMLTLGALGGAKACLDETLNYIRQRKVFGKLVADFEANQVRLLGLWSRLVAGEAYAHHCLQLLNENKRCRVPVSLCKRSLCQTAIDVADACLQLHGGYGYTTAFPPERWLRDLRLNTIGGGTSEVMAQVAAKELLG